MGDRERRELLTDLNKRLEFLHPKMAAALRAMDYQQALDCQLQSDDLRRQRDTLRPSRRHFHLMQRAGAAPVAVIARGSRQSQPVGQLTYFAAEPPDASAATAGATVASDG
jgi:hypothetical protein